jgi:ATP-dependent Clp protease ATP-binding subunit ClpC
MFEGFDEKAKRVLFLARYEAYVGRAKEIEARHLLLGLLLEADSASRPVIDASGASFEPLAAFVAGRPPQQPSRWPSWPWRRSREIPFSAEVRAIVDAIPREADSLGHARIGTVHVLLAILAAAPVGCREVLAEAGLDYEAVRSAARAA